MPPAELGTRVFSITNAASPNGSHFFTSALNVPIEQSNSFVGSLVLKGGVPDETTGVATLELAQDSFVGFQVIQNVSRLLHTPLMSLTNAISAIAVVGSILIAGEQRTGLSTALGAIAVFASVTNIVSGFLITDRMLKMFKERQKS